MNARRAILVTGAPRTGTTLVGAMLGLAHHTGVLFEPFHPDAGVAGLQTEYERAAGDGPLRLEFPYVSVDHPAAVRFQSLFDAVLTGRARYRRPGCRGRLGWVTDCARRVLTGRLALRNRWAAAWPFHRRFVVKDPHLCLACEFAHRDMGLDCAVTVRHPAATAESWIRLGWNPDLRQFWEQPILWDRHLQAFRRPDADRLSPLEKAAHAWLWINKVLLDYRERNPGMVFVRLEDLALAPVEAFQTLYRQLALPFNARIEKAIRAHTASGSCAVGMPGRPHRLKRDSRSIVEGWKRRLSRDEQRVVRDIVGETGAVYYADNTW